VVDRSFRMCIDLFKSFGPDPVFVFRSIGPKSMIGAVPLLIDQEADQVMEVLVWDPFEIEKQFYLAPT
jgi:hypothetical protein